MAADLFAQQFGNQSPQNAYFKKLLDQGLDTTPVQSPWQGASRMAMALLAGLDLRDQDQQEKASQALRMNLPGLGPQPGQPAQSGGLADALAKPEAPAQPSMAQMIANNQADGPALPAPTGKDRDLMIRAIHGEAGNQSPEGMRAVASVIRNRSITGDYGGSSISDVIRAPNQFEPVNTPAGQQRMASLPVGSNQYNNIGKTIDEAYAGNDPTNGATQFFAPKAQASLGRPVPSWAQGQGQDIGDHRFFGGQQTAQADPAALPPNSTPAQGQIPTVPPAAPAVTPQPNAGAQIPQRSPVQIDPQMAQQIRTMIGSKDPAIQQQGYALYQQFAKPREETRPLTNPQDRARYGIAPTDSNPYQVDSKGEVKPINPQPFNVNVNNQGESKFAQAYGEGKASDALNLERSADKTMQERQQLQVFKSLVQDFKTGKLAPTQSTVGAWADAIGLDPKTMEKLGVPPNAAVNGQLIESMSNQMSLGMIGTKGGEGGMPANNFSDTDMKILRNTVPGLARMQGGNLVLAEIKQRSLDRQLDKISMWDEYRSQGKNYETFERDWRQKIRSSPSILDDLPDMVRGLTNQPNAAGWSPPNAQPASQAAPASNGGVRKYNPATGKIE